MNESDDELDIVMDEVVEAPKRTKKAITAAQKAARIQNLAKGRKKRLDALKKKKKHQQKYEVSDSDSSSSSSSSDSDIILTKRKKGGKHKKPREDDRIEKLESMVMGLTAKVQKQKIKAKLQRQDKPLPITQHDEATQHLKSRLLNI